MKSCKYLFKIPCYDNETKEKLESRYRLCTCERNIDRDKGECLNPVNAGNKCPYYKP